LIHCGLNYRFLLSITERQYVQDRIGIKRAGDTPGASR